MFEAFGYRKVAYIGIGYFEACSLSVLLVGHFRVRL